jgi:hypothetical protein
MSNTIRPRGNLVDAQRTYKERDGRRVVDYDATASANFSAAWDNVRAMGSLPCANFVADQYGGERPDGPPLVLGLACDVFHAGFQGLRAAKNLGDGVVSATTARIHALLGD